MLKAQLLHEVGEWPLIESQWDELATASAAPYASPPWMLSWYRHALSSRCSPRVVVVTDRSQLLGIAPFYVDSGPGGLNRYRLLASGVSAPVQPLAVPGSESDVAALVAATLAKAPTPPDLVTFEGIGADSPWPRLIGEAWPRAGRPWLHQDMSLPAPTLSLTGRSFQEWTMSKSANFRQQVNRDRRRLEAKGAKFQLATSGKDLQRGLRDFATLHYARWNPRGGSNALDSRIERMLEGVARIWRGSERFRLWTIEVEGQTISAHIFVAGGGELAYWNGGFDESWAAQHPSIQTFMAAIEHAFTVGDRRINFGPGGQAYKYRFADGEDTLKWMTLVPGGSRNSLTRARLTPAHLRRAVASRMSPARKQQVKQRLRRVSPRHAES